MSFEECELAILRQAVDQAEAKEGKQLIKNPEIKEIIEIVESFLKTHKRICYGGTAINNILPFEYQFYDKSVELPDYDFFSPEPLKDAKHLADIYYKKGFTEVEAKAGIHAGTFKVFVNFIPVADITLLVPELYKRLSKESIVVSGIYYTPPNYLRMLMYLELSRPKGDISRWEKVLKRLTLLNKNYPLRGKDCDFIEVQRIIDPHSKLTPALQQKIFHITKDSFISQGVVFFGAMANRLYLRYLRHFKHKKIPHIPDFDVLSEDPEQTATILKERLQIRGLKKVTIHKKAGIGEIIAPHYEVRVSNETIAFIYEPLACHSYNIINMKGRQVKIATIDTMLSFYLAFLFVKRPYYDVNRIVCMSQFLFDVQQKNRLKQKGLLKRFSINCYGKQLTIERIREEKALKYKELKNKRGSKEWDFYFLKYSPGDNEGRNTKNNKKKKKRKIKNKHNTKRKRKPKRKRTKRTRKRKTKWHQQHNYLF
jgi:hypothetical protein